MRDAFYKRTEFNCIGPRNGKNVKLYFSELRIQPDPLCLVSNSFFSVQLNEKKSESGPVLKRVRWKVRWEVQVRYKIKLSSQWTSVSQKY